MAMRAIGPVASVSASPAARGVRVEVIRETDDLGVGHVHAAGVTEDVQLEPFPREQASERHDERRHAERREQRSLKQADRQAEGHRDRDGQVRVPAVMDAHHRHERGGDAAHRADRQVDLAEQQDEHHTHRDESRGRDLQHQIGEVGRGKETVVL
jgi:hypothetical protein